MKSYVKIETLIISKAKKNELLEVGGQEFVKKKKNDLAVLLIL